MPKDKRGGKRGNTTVFSSPNPNALSDRDIVDRFEDEGFSTTNNPRDALYVLRDGTLIDGFYGTDTRMEDHRMVEVLFDDMDRYTDGFWEEMYDRTKMVQLIPETKTAIVFSNSTNDITEKQKKIIKSLGYMVMSG